MSSGNWVFDEQSLRDFLSLVLFHAPDEFPIEDYLSESEQLDLGKAFQEIRDGLGFSHILSKDPQRAAHAAEVVEQCHEAYLKRELPVASAKIRELERLLGFSHDDSHGYGEKV